MVLAPINTHPFSLCLLQASIQLIFDILTQSLFEFSFRKNPIPGFDGEEFFSSVETWLRESVRGYLNPFRLLLQWSAIQRGLAARKKVQEFGRIILEKYRSSKTEGEGEAGGAALGSNEASIMDHILKNDYPSEQHRISDVVVFLVAGHETTAHTLSFFLYCLAKNPAARAKLQRELDGVSGSGLGLGSGSGMGAGLGQSGGQLLTLSDISSVDFLSHCLKESQRWVQRVQRVLLVFAVLLCV